MTFYSFPFLTSCWKLLSTLSFSRITLVIYFFLESYPFRLSLLYYFINSYYVLYFHFHHRSFVLPSLAREDGVFRYIYMLTRILLVKAVMSVHKLRQVIMCIFIFAAYPPQV